MMTIQSSIYYEATQSQQPASILKQDNIRLASQPNATQTAHARWGKTQRFSFLNPEKPNLSGANLLLTKGPKKNIDSWSVVRAYPQIIRHKFRDPCVVSSGFYPYYSEAVVDIRKFGVIMFKSTKAKKYIRLNFQIYAGAQWRQEKLGPNDPEHILGY